MRAIGDLEERIHRQNEEKEELLARLSEEKESLDQSALDKVSTVVACSVGLLIFF
jgi:hypothetical protein